MGAAVLIISGCAAGSHARPREETSPPRTTSTPVVIDTPPATASAAPDPIALSELMPPTIFGGDCDAFLGDEASNILGGGASPVRQHGGNSFEAVGGVTCEWSVDQRGLRVTVLPAVLGPKVPVQTCGTFDVGEARGDRDFCLVDAVANGMRIGGYVYSGSHATSLPIAQRLIDAFTTVARTSDAASGYSAPAGLWPVVACERLGPLTANGVKYDVITGYAGTDASMTPLEIAMSHGVYAFEGCYVQDADGATVASFSYDSGALFDRFALREGVASERVVETHAKGFDRSLEYGLTISGAAFLRGPNLLTVERIGASDLTPRDVARVIADRLDALS